MSTKRSEFFTQKLRWHSALVARLKGDALTLHVAMAIGEHLNSATGETFVGYQRIADLCGLCRRSVERAVRRLVGLGLLAVQKVRGRRSNTYRMTTDGKEAWREDDCTVAKPSPEHDCAVALTLLEQDSNLDSEDTIRLAADANAVDRSQKTAPSQITAKPVPSSSNRSLRMYRQSQAEAAIAWEALQKLPGWCGTWGDDEMSHWHTLLRKGYAADDLVDIATAFLRSAHDVPTLGDWLAGFESYLKQEGADEASALPPMPRVLAISHHHVC